LRDTEIDMELRTAWQEFRRSPKGGHRLCRPAKRPKYVAEIVVGLRVPRIEFQCLLIRTRRLLRSTDISIEVAEIEVERGIVRHQADEALVARPCVVEALQLLEQASEGEEHLRGVVGLFAHLFAKAQGLHSISVREMCFGKLQDRQGILLVLHEWLAWLA